MKTILGLTLLATPFIFIFVVGAHYIGVLAMLGCLAFAVIVAACVGVGLYLIRGNFK